MCRSALNWILPVKAIRSRRLEIIFSEAVELFFEAASPNEIQTRFHEEVYVTQMEVSVG